MAILALGLIGAGVGSLYGYTAAGFMLGSVAGQLLFPNSKNKTDNTVDAGPLVGSSMVQSSQFGVFINRGFGKFRCAGQVIWMTPPVQMTTEVVVGAVEGPMGKGSEPIIQIQRWWASNVAIAFAEFPSLPFEEFFSTQESNEGGEAIDHSERSSFVGTPRIWLNNQPYVNTLTSQDVPSSKFKWELHLGSESEARDDYIEADKGVANTPAHRGLLYVVFPELNLSKFGNALPQASAEVYERLDRIDNLEEGIEGMCLGTDNDLWVCSHTMRVVQRVDTETLEVKARVGRDDAPEGQYLGTLPAHPWRCAASPDGQYIWVTHRGASKLTRIRTSDNTWTSFTTLKYGIEVAVDVNNSVWVTYPYEGKVRKYSSAGALLYTVDIDDAPWTCYYETEKKKIWIGGNKQIHLIDITSHAVTSVTTGAFFHTGIAAQPLSSDVMCASCGSDIFVIMRKAGTFRRFRGAGTYPIGVSTNLQDPWGTYYVATFAGSRVQAYSKGLRGQLEAGTLSFPSQVVALADGRVFVGASKYGVVQMVETR